MFMKLFHTYNSEIWWSSWGISLTWSHRCHRFIFITYNCITSPALTPVLLLLLPGCEVTLATGVNQWERLTVASSSNLPKSSLRSLTSSCAVHCDARLVKPTISANKILQEKTHGKSLDASQGRKTKTCICSLEETFTLCPSGAQTKRDLYCIYTLYVLLYLNLGVRVLLIAPSDWGFSELFNDNMINYLMIICMKVQSQRVCPVSVHPPWFNNETTETSQWIRTEWSRNYFCEERTKYRP